MKNIAVNSNTALERVPKIESQKWIENHKIAAFHFSAAAKSHLQAAKYHQSGEHEKAAKFTIEAHGHSSLATEAQRDDVKHHASEH